MFPYAQTNVQLFNQLRSEGYSKKEREYVRDVYEFGQRLFTGLFLPSGKTFIDHLVGTASVLASLRVSVEIVAAGLIHAAYLHGNFGGTRKGLSEANRREVRDAVGEKVEEYIARYDRMIWHPQTIPILRDTFDELGPIDRDVLLIHLANELDHCLDFGALYFVARESWYQRFIEDHRPNMMDMAEKLGFPSLSGEMATVFGAITSAQVPMEPRMNGTQPAAYLMIPGSYRECFWVVYLTKVHRLRSGIVKRAKRLHRKGFKFMHGLLEKAFQPTIRP